MSFPESAKDFFPQCNIVCFLNIGVSLLLRLTAFERKPQQFDLWLCFPLMSDFWNYYNAKSPNQKLADWKAALHTLETPQKNLVRNTLVT